MAGAVVVDADSALGIGSLASAISAAMKAGTGLGWSQYDRLRLPSDREWQSGFVLEGGAIGSGGNVENMTDVVAFDQVEEASQRICIMDIDLGISI
ncbi:MAG: hypothetical protein JJE47_15355 [Acidimicrobiia bacterium]|nr:hypothetical protein [Acidimicrobiia bacterium]